jgi:hypothetical protein
VREERRLMVFENRVLMRIFGPKKDEVTGEWEKTSYHIISYHIIPYHTISYIEIMFLSFIVLLAKAFKIILIAVAVISSDNLYANSFCHTKWFMMNS